MVTQLKKCEAHALVDKLAEKIGKKTFEALDNKLT